MKKKRKTGTDSAGRKKAESVSFESLESLGRISHLAETTQEADLFDLLLSLARCFAALDRFQNEFLSMTCNKALTPTDHLVLNMIRLHDRPKTIVEIARILNRDDTANINYSLRKLQKLQLVEKTGLDNLRGMPYQITQTGREMTNHYARIRKNMLFKNLPKEEDWAERIDITVKTLAQIQTIYDMATSYLVTHRMEFEDR